MAESRWSGPVRAGTLSKYSELDPDYGVRLVGDSTCWEDLRVGLERAKAGGAGIPNFEKMKDDGAGSTGVYGYLFADGDYLLFNIQIPHAWKVGSIIYPHFHICCKTDGSGKNTKLQFEYSWASIDGTFTNSTVESRTVACGAAFKHLIYDVPSGGVSGTGQGISSILLCRVARAAAASDNYTGGIYFVNFDIHYEIDSMGSRYATSK